MLHFWQKPTTKMRSTRVTVAVIDNDDDFRRAALRVLRRLDVAGVGLLDTAAAMRLLTSTPPTLVIVEQARISAMRSTLSALPQTARPRVIGTIPRDAARIAQLEGCVQKPLDAGQFSDVITSVLYGSARKKRVLLVDDDEDIRESYSVVLEDEGYEVVPAPNGKAALQALEQGLSPDVILLDLMMPVMNGHEMFDQLQRSAHQGTPVVVITAGDGPAPPGAPMLRKPVDMYTLLNAVHRVEA